MEISEIQNTKYKVIISQRFLNEIENVATKSTNGTRGTSDVVNQLGEFITFTIRFLQCLGNLVHKFPYLALGDDLYGYVTEPDFPSFGIGTIKFRFEQFDNSTDIIVEDIVVDLKNYNMLIENKQLKQIFSLIERVEKC